MENSQLRNAELKRKRALRVRSKLKGTSLKPRLCVVKTNAHIIAQIIDDEQGVTLGSISTFSKELKNTEFGKKNKDSGKVIGQKIAQLAKAKNIDSVVFDRGSSKYHGVIAAVADGARENGLHF